MNLPARHGVEIASQIADIDPQIFIIFATGYASYMREAFDVYAFDYLLKPYTIDRLRETVERIKKLCALRKRSVCTTGKSLAQNRKITAK